MPAPSASSAASQRAQPLSNSSELPLGASTPDGLLQFQQEHLSGSSQGHAVALSAHAEQPSQPPTLPSEPQAPDPALLASFAPPIV